MSEVITDRKNIRKPSTAVVLSLIMIGLGHIYCGKITKGLILAFLSSIIMPLILVALSVGQSLIQTAILIALVFLLVIIQLFTVIDSWYTAKYTPKNYVLKDYNRWYIYLLLLLTGTGGAAQFSFNVRSTQTEAFYFVGTANYPTILPDDRFLVSKRAYKRSDPKKGDMIVFANPENRHEVSVNRVVAVAGDTVEIIDNQLYINDQKLERQKLPQSVLDNIRIDVCGKPLEGEVFYEFNGGAKYKIFISEPTDDQAPSNFAKMTVPQQHCFVLGDNRNHSKGSRKVGPIPLATIKGRASWLYRPSKDWSRFGRLNAK